MTSRPGQGYVEQTPLLRIGMFLGRRKDRVEQRVVRDLRRKAVSSTGQAEYHDVIGLKPFEPCTVLKKSLRRGCCLARPARFAGRKCLYRPSSRTLDGSS